MITDGNGIPPAVSLSGGNRNDILQLLPLIEAIPPVRGKVGKPRRRPRTLYADRAYDHDRYSTAVSSGTRESSRSSRAGAPRTAPTWACIAVVE